MPKWLSNAIFYEIYPQSFYDSNQDGIGDIQGIIEKLDYIKELGCNALWINPCFDSPFKDAGYDIRDYKKVAPRYGTNEDLEELFKVAHKKHIKVILDLVPGHTSEEHEWFLESTKPEYTELSNRYIWTDHIFKKPKNLPFIGGEYDRNGVYILNFFKSQPALNYGFYKVEESWQLPIDHPDSIATREALKEIMRFWLNKGCDGFRVDLAYSLVKNDEERKGTIMLWQNIRAMLDDEYPQAALVSEWGVPEEALKAGFHMDFYLNHKFEGYRSLLRDFKNVEDNSFFRKDAKHDIMGFLNEYLQHYENTKDIGYFCPITCNHDTLRPTYTLNENELKLAYAFLLTLPGVPFIYYGDEIGMKYLEIPTKEGGYHRTGSRTPMQWDRSLPNLGFSKAMEDELYLPIDKSAEAPSVSQQKSDPNSLYHCVQSILKIRNENPDLQSIANFEVVYAKEFTLPFVYKRGNFLIAVNPSGNAEKVKLEDINIKNVVYMIGDASFYDHELELSSQTFVIYKIQQRRLL